MTLDQTSPDKLSDEELAEAEIEFRQRDIEWRAKCETEWRAAGNNVAWLFPEPDWTGGSLIWPWFFDLDLKQPMRRTMMFRLHGGGAFRYRDVAFPVLHDDPEQWRRLWHRPKLHIQAHVCDRIVTANAITDATGSEMSSEAVIGCAPQDILDRVAATLAPTTYDEVAWRATLDGRQRCAFCRRPLHDEISRLIGYGPDCAHRNGVPHTKAAAEEQIEMRKQLRLE